MRKKEIIKLIGEENLDKFSKWMYGQTVSMYKNGEVNYYPWDVEAFVEKLKTGYDRQTDSEAWD